MSEWLMARTIQHRTEYVNVIVPSSQNYGDYKNRFEK